MAGGGVKDNKAMRRPGGTAQPRGLSRREWDEVLRQVQDTKLRSRNVYAADGGRSRGTRDTPGSDPSTHDVLTEHEVAEARARTSVRLPPYLWTALEDIARREGMTDIELIRVVARRINHQVRPRHRRAGSGGEEAMAAVDEADRDAPTASTVAAEVRKTLSTAVRIFIVAYYRKATELAEARLRRVPSIGEPQASFTGPPSTDGSPPAAPHDPAEASPAADPVPETAPSPDLDTPGERRS